MKHGASHSRVSKMLVFSLMFVALSAGANSWTEIPSRYEVPVSEELKPFANFELKDFRKRAEGDKIEIQYTLPVHLTGDEVEIHAMSSDGGKTFEGPLSQLNCTQTECVARYPGLGIDPLQVEAKLIALGFIGNELVARKNVAARFSGGDPAGIIYFYGAPATDKTPNSYGAPTESPLK